MNRKKIMVWVTILAVLVCTVTGTSSSYAASNSTVKKACAAAMKKTGNLNKIGYKSSTASDFDAISYKYNKKISDFFFVTSDNTAYVICAAKAKTVKDAKKIYKAFSDYKYNKMHDTYFKKDYTSAEQNIIKNAIYGRKGKYIWYISMSSRQKNQSGEKALKKYL